MRLCTTIMQSCKCDGVLEVWDINEASLVSKLDLNLNTKVRYRCTLYIASIIQGCFLNLVHHTLLSNKL